MHTHYVNDVWRVWRVKDARWVATVLLEELVGDNFVPDGRIQGLRQYGPRINGINRDMVRREQRIDTILQRCDIRLSNHVSCTKNKSYRKVVDAPVAGIVTQETVDLQLEFNFLKKI